MDSKKILSIDGKRLMPYQGLSHILDNLLHDSESVVYVNSFNISDRYFSLSL